jgi:hypothetical protein
MTESPLLTRKEAAAYLRIGLRTLQRLDVPFREIRPGLKRYHREDLDRWLEKRKVCTSDGETASPTRASRTKDDPIRSRRAREILQERQRRRRASTTGLYAVKGGRE